MGVKIALSMGDAAGIGPELLVKLFARDDIDCGMAVVGDLDVLERANRVLGNPVRLRKVSSWDECEYAKRVMDVLDMRLLSGEYFALACADAVSGKASVEYLLKTARLALDGDADAIISAPLNKEAMKMAGYAFQGQTELLADYTGTKDFAMVLMFGPVKLFYQTNHVPLKSIFGEIAEDKVLRKLTFIDGILREMGEPNRKIAVAALNPHAGENGKMGTEEVNDITPAICKAVGMGIEAVGPIPADSVFIRAKNGEFGAVLAMYHDQGNIAAKLMGFGAGVTYVAGLPIIRTSVAHGTAYDIAGKGLADETALAEAVKLAARLAQARKRK